MAKMSEYEGKRNREGRTKEDGNILASNIGKSENLSINTCLNRHIKHTAMHWLDSNTSSVS
jgi:hypothetical protein